MTVRPGGGSHTHVKGALLKSPDIRGQVYVQGLFMQENERKWLARLREMGWGFRAGFCAFARHRRDPPTPVPSAVRGLLTCPSLSCSH